jgi:DNA-binding XRE family transcriptional regulator
MESYVEVANIMRKYPKHKQAGILLRLIRHDAKEKSKRKNMHTQIWLAKKIGVSNVWICLIETGRVKCSIWLAKAIAKIYKIDYKLLLS